MVPKKRDQVVARQMTLFGTLGGDSEVSTPADTAVWWSRPRVLVSTRYRSPTAVPHPLTVTQCTHLKWSPRDFFSSVDSL